MVTLNEWKLINFIEAVARKTGCIDGMHCWDIQLLPWLQLSKPASPSLTSSSKSLPSSWEAGAGGGGEYFKHYIVDNFSFCWLLSKRLQISQLCVFHLVKFEESCVRLWKTSDLVDHRLPRCLLTYPSLQPKTTLCLFLCQPLKTFSPKKIAWLASAALFLQLFVWCISYVQGIMIML